LVNGEDVMAKKFALDDGSVVVNDPIAMLEKLSWNDPRKGAEITVCKTVGGTIMR
jgi:hypothetical protein